MKRPEEEAARWILQARDDLEFAKWLVAEDRGFDKGCFIAQQAAEKALKAVAYREGARQVLGHSVASLLDSLLPRHPELRPLRPHARRLDRFYIPTRYPNGLPAGAPCESFDRQDLDQAVDLAGGLVEAAEGLLRGEG
jgi:HEPN domain-containing protein